MVATNPIVEAIQSESFLACFTVDDDELTLERANWTRVPQR